MRNVSYIAREITLSEFGLIRIDEEGVFSSFEIASDFLKDLREEGEYETNPSTADIEFRHEIIKLKINEFESYKTIIKWTYKLNGELISKVSFDDNRPNCFETVDYKSRFSVGEIVRVKCNYEEPASCLTQENYGVISHIPTAKEAWQASGKPTDEWDSAYIVWLISHINGYLGHHHLNELCLDKFGEELPEELEFLKILSEYLTNKNNIINPDLIKKALSGDVVVKKINYFFSN